MTDWLGRSCTVCAGLFMAAPKKKKKSGRLNADLLMISCIGLGVKFPRRSRKREIDRPGRIASKRGALTTEGEKKD